jgi:Holliday junction resolvasome RuvABC DNA-binding subunit
MNRNQVLSLRMPSDLKKRLEHQAKLQGISMNQMATYLINTELTQLETIEKLEHKISTRKLTKLKRKVKNILKKVPARNVPEWDKI